MASLCLYHAVGSVKMTDNQVKNNKMFDYDSTGVVYFQANQIPRLQSFGGTYYITRVSVKYELFTSRRRVEIQTTLTPYFTMISVINCLLHN